MSAFQSLIDELQQLAIEPLAKADPESAEPLAKANPDADDAQDDAEIKAAADGDRDDDGESDGEDINDDDDDGDDDDADGEATMKKSFTVTVDGQEFEAYDGEALIKSLRREMRTGQAQLEARLTESAEALELSVGLIKSLREDNAALRARVDQLAQSGRGRKSVLNVHEKTLAGEVAPAADAADGVTPRHLMAKALDAQKAGRVTGGDVAMLDLYLGRGLTPPEPLLAKIGG